MTSAHNRSSRCLVLVLATSFFLTAPVAHAITEIGGYTVRCAYLIPADRTARVDAEERFQEWFMLGRAWYADQMQRYGLGDPDLDYTFRLETEGDGVTPVVHFVYLSEDRDDLLDEWDNGDWGAVCSAALAAGVPLNSDEEVWFLVPELHQMEPDGSTTGGVALGLENFAGICDSSALAFDTSFLTNDNYYDGVIYTPFGPYEMVQDVTWAWWNGDVFSRVTAVIVYGWMHELGHAFYLAHNSRNDLEVNENLMGVGWGGYRGWLNPGDYPDNYMKLSYASALVLSRSPYFNDGFSLNWQSAPSITITTSGNISPQNGKVRIYFTASDNDGLSHALLYDAGGHVLGEKDLSGNTSVNTYFETEYWAPGTTTFVIDAADVNGSIYQGWPQATTVTIASGNQAPQTQIRLWPYDAGVNDTVTLTAETFDPEWQTCQYEWDVDGDGTYDIGPTYNTSVTTSYNTAGVYFVYCRTTDTAGGVAVTAPLLIVVEGSGVETLLEDDFEDGNFSKWTDGGNTDWDLATSQYHSAGHSAHAGSFDNDLISDNLDTSGKSSITISFWYREDDIDDSDDVYLQLFDGTSYDNKYELGLATEDTWTYYETTLDNSGGDAQYFISNFRIKFEGSSIDYGENLWIDDVLITAE